MDQHEKKKIIGSINWNFLNTVLQTLLTFGVGVVLARILEPEDFGLFGLTIIILGLINIIFSPSISRFIVHKENIEKMDIETSLGISILLSLLLYSIIWFISPFVAIFFNNEQLTELIRIYTVSIFFIALSSVLRGILIKNMNFRLLFYSDMVAMLFGYSVCSIIMAINGFGVFSLIYASVLKEALLLITLIGFSKVRFLFRIDSTRIKGIFWYSSGVSLSSIFGYTANNADYIVIGKFLNPTALGLYTRAFTIMTLPLSKISMTIYDVIFSVFSSVKEDIEQIKNIYLKSIKIIALISFPILSFMMISSELIINGLYGEKWNGAVTVLKILCIAGFFRVITNSSGAVAKATGKVYKEAWRQLIFALVLIIGALISYKYGIEGVGVAVVISSVIFYLSMAHLTIQIINITWIEFLKSQFPGIVIVLIISLINLVALNIVDFFFTKEMYLLKLAILMIVSSISFLILIKTLPSKLIGEEGRNLLSLYFEKLKSISARAINYADSN